MYAQTKDEALVSLNCIRINNNFILNIEKLFTLEKTYNIYGE